MNTTHDTRAIEDAALGVYLPAVNSEPAITGALCVAVSGTAGQLQSLDKRRKTLVSLTDKVARKAAQQGVTPQQAADSIADILRYTVTTAQTADLVPAMLTIVNRLVSKGWAVVDAEHSFVDGNPYKGIHLTLSLDGQRCEVQFHTQSALAVKRQAHGDYKVYRDMAAPSAVKQEAFGRCVALWSDVVAPAEIPAFIASAPVSVNDYRGMTL